MSECTSWGAGMGQLWSKVSAEEPSRRGALAIRDRRNSLRIAAALVAALSMVEPVFRPVTPPLAALHAAWVVVLFGGAAAVASAPSRALPVVQSVIAVASVLLFWSAVLSTGGLYSSDFHYASVAPLALCVVFQDQIAATFAGSVAIVAAVALTGDSNHGEWIDMLTITTAMGGLAVFGSWSFRSLRLTELHHERELSNSERRRARSERLAQLGQLSAGVAHEISNPLTAVLANLQELEDDVVNAALKLDERRLLFADINHGADRICQIVGDLKGYARGDRGRRETCRVDDAISGALRLAKLRIGKSVEVRRAIGDDVAAVLVHRRTIEQVLLNLLVNAGDALAASGTRKPEILVTAVRDGEAVRMVVEDNGPGIAPEVADRLFEPFATTKADGTGLGLALARECVIEVGGLLDLEPTAIGARFVIRVPAVAA